MKIKLNGITEFDGFTVIIHVIRKKLSCDVDTITEWCQLKAVEKLTLRLMQIAATQRQFKKKISIEIDEAQTIVLYLELPATLFAPYEATLANKILEQLELQFYKARALQMSLRELQTNYKLQSYEKENERTLLDA
jgi:hypothetical protein